MKKLSVKVLSIVLAMTMILVTGCSSTDANNPGEAGGNGSKEARSIQVGHVNPSKDDDQFQKYAALFKKNLEEISDG